MSAIERFFAAAFLVAAVGGTAAFAHHLVGSPEGAAPVQLAATPRQHVSAPGGTVWAPLPAPVRVLTRPEPSPAVSRILRPVPARPIAVPAATKPKPVRNARPAAPAPTPKPDIAAGPRPTPVPAQPATPEPPRVLASTVATATTAAPAAPAPAVAPAPVAKERGNGRKVGHEKHGKAPKIRPDEEAPEAAPAPAPVPAPAAAPAPAPAPAPAAAPPVQPSDDQGPGSGHGRGNAYGRLKSHDD
jgi:hypothetical protein